MSNTMQYYTDLKGETAPRRTVSAELAARLEKALDNVGTFGEVHSVIDKARVRFIDTLRSGLAIGLNSRCEEIKWQPFRL